MRNTILGAVAVVIIASAAFLFFKDPITAPTTPLPDSNTTLPSVTIAPESAVNSLDVDDQIAGATVNVKFVQLEKSGFVNVHEDSRGAPGAVIGVSTLLPAGTSTAVVIPVSPSTISGKSYFAMLHTDNGDGKYEFPGPDLPIQTATGDVVMKKFTATGATVNVNLGADLPEKTVTLSMTMDSGNFYFKPDRIMAKVNQPVTIKFTNSGFHTFTIDALGINQTITGSSGGITFTPDKKGTFEFYCAVGNHRDLGMKGTIVVE